MTAHFKTPAARAVMAARQHLIETKDAGDPFAILTKQFGQHADETLKRIEDQEQKLQTLGTNFVGLQKKLAVGGVSGSALSWGEQMAEAEGLEEFSRTMHRKGVSLVLEVKELTTIDTSGGALTQPFRDPNVVMLTRNRPSIRSLLNVVQLTGGVAEYVVQTERPTNAQMVAEGQLKPESDMALENRQAAAQVIAHWIMASRQILEDAPQLRDLIDTELRFGLDEKEDEQLLNGDGIAPNLNGLIPNATAYVDPLGITDPTLIDIIASAILQNATANLPADGIVIHPTDWMRMRTLKDADGKYILGNPGDAVAPRLFGLPVVETQAMMQGEFLVGAFRRAATLYDRWAPQVIVSSEDRDAFIRNRVVILAEKRIALAVKQPAALTHGNFAIAP